MWLERGTEEREVEKVTVVWTCEKGGRGWGGVLRILEEMEVLYIERDQLNTESTSAPGCRSFRNSGITSSGASKIKEGHHKFDSRDRRLTINEKDSPLIGIIELIFKAGIREFT